MIRALTRSASATRRRRRRAAAIPAAPPESNEEADIEAPPAPRSLASMTAFDAMPKRFRVYCADYPRTASGIALRDLLAECGSNVPRAKRMLQELLPVTMPPPKRKRRTRRSFKL